MEDEEGDGGRMKMKAGEGRLMAISSNNGEMTAQARGGKAMKTKDQNGKTGIGRCLEGQLEEKLWHIRTEEQRSEEKEVSKHRKNRHQAGVGGGRGGSVWHQKA